MICSYVSCHHLLSRWTGRNKFNFKLSSNGNYIQQNGYNNDLFNCMKYMRYLSWGKIMLLFVRTFGPVLLNFHIITKHFMSVDLFLNERRKKDELFSPVCDAINCSYTIMYICMNIVSLWSEVAYSEKSRKKDCTVETVLKFNKHSYSFLIVKCPSELIKIKMTLCLNIYMTVVACRMFTYKLMFVAV